MQETGMESAISNERFYQKAIGVVGGGGRQYHRREEGRRKSQTAKGQSQSGQFWTEHSLKLCSSPTQAQPPLEWMAPSVFCLNVKSKIDSNSREGIPFILLGAFAHLLAIGSSEIIKWMLHHPKKNTIHSCFPLKIVSAEIFMGRIFQQLYTEGGNSCVSFPQTWFLGGIFMLISLMLESFRRKIGSERALTNYNCPVF